MRYTTENAYRSHANSKKHRVNEVRLKAAAKAAQRFPVPESESSQDSVPSAVEAEISLPKIEETQAVTEQLAVVSLTGDADAAEAEINQTIDENITASRSQSQPTQCLFHPESAPSIEDNLALIACVPVP